MDPPPSPAPPLSATAAAAAVAAAPLLNYPDSVDSSPRSRNTDSWDEQWISSVPGGAKLRLMCSYGGHIVPRPHDKSLRYVGGDTRIVVVDRHTTLSDITNRLSKTLLNGQLFSLKYQLPNEDLDSLISITTDEDLENMIEEYDRLTTTTTTNASLKSSRLRLFLFPTKSDSGSSIGSLLDNSTKSEDWFLNALNGSTRGQLSDSASVNCLLGLEDDVAITGNANSSEKDVEAQLESFRNVKGVVSNTNKQGFQDVHSGPDSPLLETSSSFGSTSSSPSIANLPPARVHVEDQKAVAGGIDEQFSHMSVGAAVQKQDDGVFVVTSTPPTVLTTFPTAATGVHMGSAQVACEFSNRVFSDDERSEHGLPAGYRKPSQAQGYQQPFPPQSQPKPTAGFDLSSPDSVSSDSSITNPLSRQRPMIYQDPSVQISPGNNRMPVSPVEPKLSDSNSRVQMQQVQDSGYVLPTQFDQQLNPQQQLTPQQQQFIQAGTHFYHHHPTGAVPMTSYYPIYPSQQQQHHPHHAPDQQYTLYYTPARQAQAYNLPAQQPNYSEAAATAPSSRPQTPPPPAMIPTPSAYNPARNAPTSKPQMSAGVYRTATSAAPPLVQVPSSQHQPQYVGFSQIHHPSQSFAPTSAATANYAYEFADTHAQMYYTRPLAPQLAAQYQTMTSAPTMILPEASAQLPTENIKQQIRTSQPL